MHKNKIPQICIIFTIFSLARFVSTLAENDTSNTKKLDTLENLIIQLTLSSVHWQLIFLLVNIISNIANDVAFCRFNYNLLLFLSSL